MVLPPVADLAPAGLGPSLVAVGALELQSSLEAVQSSTWFLWWLRLGSSNFCKHFLQPSWGHHLCHHHKPLFVRHQKIFSSNGVPCSRCSCFFLVWIHSPCKLIRKTSLERKKQNEMHSFLEFCSATKFMWKQGCLLDGWSRSCWVPSLIENPKSLRSVITRIVPCRVLLC